jgi:hypothetical protein
VVLAADSEAALLELGRALLFDDIPHAAFRDPDLGNHLFAIGIEPVERSTVRRYLRGFSLFGGQDDVETRS